MLKHRSDRGGSAVLEHRSDRGGSVVLEYGFVGPLGCTVNNTIEA